MLLTYAKLKSHKFKTEINVESVKMEIKMPIEISTHRHTHDNQILNKA